ncbi:hypothetical protein [Exiguobacterium undae]|uniref:hypothetical protein n=1 Tax=Exiguobacterium undae TaxID=169177 RepID=UPI00384F5185
MKMSKKIMGLVATGVLAVSFAATASAASESLNNGGATWSGGISSSDNLYSQLRDNKADGLKYKVRVWVVNDKGTKSEKTGTTTGKGAPGQVKISVGATNSNPFVANRSGYNDFSVIK